MRGPPHQRYDGCAPKVESGAIARPRSRKASFSVDEFDGNLRAALCVRRATTRILSSLPDRRDLRTDASEAEDAEGLPRHAEAHGRLPAASTHVCVLDAEVARESKDHPQVSSAVLSVSDCVPQTKMPRSRAKLVSIAWLCMPVVASRRRLGRRSMKLCGETRALAVGEQNLVRRKPLSEAFGVVDGVVEHGDVHVVLDSPTSA